MSQIITNMTNDECLIKKICPTKERNDFKRKYKHVWPSNKAGGEHCNALSEPFPENTSILQIKLIFRVVHETYPTVITFTNSSYYNMKTLCIR